MSALRPYPLRLTLSLATVPALLLALSVLAAPALPCTAFLVCGDGKVLMGNNEDFWNPEVRIWFVPAPKGRFGRVYLGYDNLYPQGGMNERGLAFDGFATAKYPMHEQEGKVVFHGRLLDEVMATCATVEDVIAMLSRYDLRMLESAMLMYCDKSGDSVIVEGDEFVRKEGSFQVVTNFYQSRQAGDRGICPRFDAAVERLEGAKEVSLPLCRKVLAATAQEGDTPTQYSNVFDLEKGLIYLYHFHDFEDVVAFDLEEELKKGAHVLEIARLFPQTFAYRSYLQKRKHDRAQELARRRVKPVDSKILDKYVGRYAISVPGVSEIVMTIRRDGRKIFASAKGGTIRRKDEEVELIPESETSFFHIGNNGTTTIRFELGGGDAKDRIVITPPLGGPVRGARIE
jgi:penicillin V acylase-like amidase (Ntn superfamily)